MGLDEAEVVEARHQSGAEIGAEEIAGRRLKAQSPLGGAATARVEGVYQRAVRAIVPNAPVADGGKNIAVLEGHAIGRARTRNMAGSRGVGGVRQPDQGG
ncbi:MAG: hypothetical protein M3Z04_22615 [Chloroflexota bacterium]|nr:hypothetical protein [Chloroflexota bacterium]